jgi:THO complex subunit 2
MAPKRKRTERSSGEGGRPSPHRPGDTALGQHDRDFYDGGGRGGRGRNTRRNDRRDSTQSQGGRGGGSSLPSASPAIPRPTSSSSQIAPSSAIAKPFPAPTANPPTPVPSNYCYDILTAEKISAWAQGGRQDIVNHGIQSRDDVDITELSSLFQEFIHSVVEGRLDSTDAGTCVKEILGPDTQEVIKDSYSFEPHTLFLDTLAIVMDNDSDLLNPQLRDFLAATEMSPTLMRQVLDASLLTELGLIRETFVKLGIRHATNLLYRQANYNLLREETEGYSKLTTELYAICTTEAPTSEVAQLTFEKIKGLIGTFDLDVGRVLDITLDVFAAVIIKHYKLFVRLLRASSWWPRSSLKQDPISGGLPKWAVPDAASRVTDVNGSATESQDENHLEEQKAQRDVQFWDRARQLNIDAFFELGGRKIANVDKEHMANADPEKGAYSDAEFKWMEITKTLPPAGNRVAAQLLGFKLRFYVSEARDDGDVLPANLIYLAALLIKIGFLSLTDLYPHIWPFDDDMPEWRDRRIAQIEEQQRKTRLGGAMNALMMAGALPDDTVPASTTSRPREAVKADTEQKATTAENVEGKSRIPEDTTKMKALLLANLLTIGAIPESLFMLGKFPWLPEAFPDILPRIHRILHQSISKIYQDSRPNPAQVDLTQCPSKRVVDTDQSGAPKGSVKLLPLPPNRRPYRWPHMDACDHGPEHGDYKFYWDEWMDSVPVCQSVDDIFTLCNTFLNVSGVKIGKDEDLLAKLASIGAKSLGDDNSQSNMTRWQELLRRLLVPALSLTKANASIVSAIWGLLKLYPTSTRYAIYAEWHEGPTSRLPAMKAAFTKTRLDTLSTMKRLSLTNLSEMAKTLAKTSYSSPGVVFKVALDQIESYANLIEAFVECAKYFTELAYDVLVWSLMSSLGGEGRTRTQETSVLLTSKWLQALSKFSGKVFRRYSIMDPTPVIQYVNKELDKGNSTDLIILKELVSSMGGVVPTLDFTDDQVLAMSGGEALRRQTLLSVQDRRFDSGKSSNRLMFALTRSRIAGPLLLNLAQYRQSAIHRISEDNAHIKYLATMVDDSHQILIQYLDLLRSNLEPEKFDELVPSIGALMTEFGMDANLAFLIGRDSLSDRIVSLIAVKSEEKQAESPAGRDAPASKDGDGDGDGDGNGDGDISMAEAAGTNGVSQDRQPATGTSMQSTGHENGEKDSKTASPSAQTNGRKPDKQPDSLQPITDPVRSTQPADVWRKITPEFHVIFWALQLGDINSPQESYQAAYGRVLEKQKEIIRDRADMSRSGVQKRKRQATELSDIASQLKTEMQKHSERLAKIKFCIGRRAKSWFPATMSKVNGSSDVILEQCILPRLTLSPSDAEYSYRFIRILHASGAPNFKLHSLYDRFFTASRLRSMMFNCTVREAEYLGRFIKNVLRDLSKWHREKGDYETDALGGSKSGKKERNLLGFATGFDQDGKPTAFIEHDQFRDVLYGWHKNLNIALKSCLGGMEWMHIRNAITVLKSVIDFFPAVDFMGNNFAEQLKAITEREAASKSGGDDEVHRVDLSVAAQTALSGLQRRKPNWIIVQAFRSNTVRPFPSLARLPRFPNNASQSQSEPKPGDSSPARSNLRATAPEFKPHQQAK